MVSREFETEANVRNEATETLMLAVVLSQGLFKEAALEELRRRKALAAFEEVDFSYMTNLSGIC